MELKIDAVAAGLRLDKAVADLTELSRGLANEQIKNGQILVNGEAKKPSMPSKRVISFPMKYLSQR